MLMLAKEQGEDLLRLKQETPHGAFKERVEKETCVSYRQAMKYMRVAKLAPQGNFAPETGINAFLDSFAEEQPAKRKAPLSLTREDAEYVLKINALAERGATDGEKDAAEAKLDNLAKQYGTDADTLWRLKPLGNFETHLAMPRFCDRRHAQQRHDEQHQGRSWLRNSGKSKIDRHQGAVLVGKTVPVDKNLVIRERNPAVVETRHGGCGIDGRTDNAEGSRRAKDDAVERGDVPCRCG
jgi:hypothetical protein